MMLSLASALLPFAHGVLIARDPTPSSGISRDAFENWAAAHGRHYTTEGEADARFLLYEANERAMKMVSAVAPLAHFAMDEFGDWSEAELEAQRPLWGDEEHWRAISRAAVVQHDFSEDAEVGPIDWVAKGAVTAPISQGRCGTCAQFSSTANIEAQWHLAGHPLIPLAVQEMVDCSSYTGPYGMGWVASVHHGLDKAADYPLANHSDPTLKGCRSPCNATAANHSFARIDGAACIKGADYSKEPGDNETEILAWLAKGPLSVSVAAGVLNGYKGGIISGVACNTTKVDHAVLLVGYGEDKGVAYWKLKNSWGPKFGEGGYFRVEHGVHCLGMRGACQSFIGKPPWI
eukprot:SAG11_NODE_272_length_11319_cov_9.730481_7_plen_347_part_00